MEAEAEADAEVHSNYACQQLPISLSWQGRRELKLTLLFAEPLEILGVDTDGAHTGPVR